MCAGDLKDAVSSPRPGAAMAFCETPCLVDAEGSVLETEESIGSQEITSKMNAKTGAPLKTQK